VPAAGACADTREAAAVIMTMPHSAKPIADVVPRTVKLIKG
jgi:hypothetical protein